MKTTSTIRAVVFALGFLVLTAAILLYSWDYYSSNLPPSPTSIDCSKGYNEGMTPEEVSRLMGIPLVDVTWLPNDLKIASQIRPYGLEWFDSSNGVTCVIRITYPNLSIDILSLTDVIRSTIYPAYCGRVQGISKPFIHCSGEFATSEGYVAITIFTTYPLKIAQKIADGIRIIESE